MSMKDKSLVIRDVSIVPVDEPGKVIERGTVTIEAGVITAVEEGLANPNLDQQGNHGRVIDGTGLVAIPGLINGHTHTPMSLLRGYADDLPLMRWLEDMVWPFEAHLTPQDIYWGALLSMTEMLKAGITTFLDMYNDMDRVAQAVEDSGIRGLLSHGMIDGPDANRKLETGIAFVEEFNGSAGGRIEALLAPHAPYTCSPEFLQQIVQASGQLDCKLNTHLSETQDEQDTIAERYGLTPAAYLERHGVLSRPLVAAHGVHLSEADIELLSQHQVGVVHNPKSNMKLASGAAPVTRMIEAGVPVGLGTDSQASNNALDLFEEMRFASYLQKVTTLDPVALPAWQTLELATLGGARALGIDAYTGSIEVGKRADLALVSMEGIHLQPRHDLVSHLVYAAKSCDVRYTIVDGEIVMEDGVVVSVDERALCKEAQQRVTRLLEEL